MDMKFKQYKKLDFSGATHLVEVEDLRGVAQIDNLLYYGVIRSGATNVFDVYEYDIDTSIETVVAAYLRSGWEAQNIVVREYGLRVYIGFSFMISAATVNDIRFEAYEYSLGPFTQVSFTNTTISSGYNGGLKEVYVGDVFDQNGTMRFIASYTTFTISDQRLLYYKDFDFTGAYGSITIPIADYYAFGAVDYNDSEKYKWTKYVASISQLKEIEFDGIGTIGPTSTIIPITFTETYVHNKQNFYFIMKDGRRVFVNQNEFFYSSDDGLNYGFVAKGDASDNAPIWDKNAILNRYELGGMLFMIILISYLASYLPPPLLVACYRAIMASISKTWWLFKYEFRQCGSYGIYICETSFARWK